MRSARCWAADCSERVTASRPPFSRCTSSSLSRSSPCHSHQPLASALRCQGRGGHADAAAASEDRESSRRRDAKASGREERAGEERCGGLGPGEQRAHARARRRGPRPP
eukprot:327382-Rhodomonas_salina.2